jgi:predicted SnoaL-like aldol condensation-catalyzing enzyme
MIPIRTPLVVGSLAFLLVLPQATLVADTVELKSGEIIQGKIVETGPDFIKIQVQISPSITDDRLLSRAELKGFAVDSGDEAAFEKIRDIATPGTVLKPEKCETLIDEKLQPFLEKFPKSPRAVDVKKQIDVISRDIDRLRAGEVRVAGTWIAPAAFATEKYQIEAAALLDRLREQVDAGDYVAAMNLVDQLRRYPESTAWMESMPLTEKATTRLVQQLNLMIQDLPETVARRQAAIDRTPPEQRQPIVQAVAAENAVAVAAAATAQKNQQRFYTLYRFDEKGLKAMRDSALQIDKEICAINRKAIAKKILLVERANHLLNDYQLDAAQTTLTQLREIWPRYEGLPRLEQRFKTGDDARKARQSAIAEKAARDTEKKKHKADDWHKKNP